MAVGKLAAALVVVVAVFYLLLPTINAVAFESKDNVEFEWQLLSANNFSSQIRLHPHVLLFITVPWCGESRSLMSAISQKLTKEQNKYSSLKLMLVNRHRDRVLADSLGAAEGIAILCYRHAVPYKYQGSLRVEDILSSAYYLILLAAEELPLKRFGNSKDLESFLTSTDKAVLLLESCGWTSKLLAQNTGNETVQGGLLPGDLNKDNNRTLGSGRPKNLKDFGNEMSSEVEDGCGESPWVGEFSAENGTASPTNEDVPPTFGIPCSFDEYNKFQSFFLKFMEVARDRYLPPQRQRYGFVSDRSLLSPLGIEVSDQWALIISYAACPACLKKLREETYLQDVLEKHDLPAVELLDDGKGPGPALPSDKPSIVLFVDRTSDSIETTKRSQEALHAFKELALQHWKSYPMDRLSNDWPKRTLRMYQGSASMFGNHRSLLSPSSHIKLKDKMSIMIINEGEHVALDNKASNLQTGSLREILTYLLGQKKQSKLSSLAKEAGFQLLSEEIDVKIADQLSSLEESQSQDSAKKLDEISEESVLEMNKDYTNNASLLVDNEEQFQPNNVDTSYDDCKQKASIELANKESGFVDLRQSLNDHEIASAVDLDFKMQNYAEVDKSEGLNYHFNGFTGSFFFCDGNQKFLRSLTDDSEVPRMVIIDPMSQQHYVYSKEGNYSFSSISNFIDGFLNGSLILHRRSGPLQKSIEMPRPPFVNLDFHEKDSIPCVTTETFSELVLGSGPFDAENATNAWRKDVVVLFSSSWCGVCQRMELVVREIYRALKGFRNMIKSESNSMELYSEDDVDELPKLPNFYSIDCTLNECSWILKSMGQREIYPTLLLFPAERKTAIPYDGNMMVTDVIKFIANHGTNSHHLARQKGKLWTDEEEKDRHDSKFRAAFMSGDNQRSSDVKDKQFGAVLKNVKLQNQVSFKLSEKEVSQTPAVGSFLVATELLHGLNPFNKARILVVAADHSMGFQGLIVNKPISWDSIPDFEDVKLLEEAPIYFGGPVVQQEMPLVSLTRSPLNDQYPQILPGVYFLDQLATINIIEEVNAGNQSATEYWFFWGYSGWSSDQLSSEIDEGVWSIRVGNIEDLYWP